MHTNPSRIGTMPRKLHPVRAMPFEPRPFLSYRCRIGRAGHFVVSLASLRHMAEMLRDHIEWQPRRSVLKGDTLNLWEPIEGASAGAAYGLVSQPLVALATIGDDYWDAQQIASACRAFGFRDRCEIDLGVMLRALDSAYHRRLLERDNAGRFRFRVETPVTRFVAVSVYQSETAGLSANMNV